MKELDIPVMIEYPEIFASASDTFAIISKKFPSTFVYLSTGYTNASGEFTEYSLKIHFNEEVCSIGSWYMAHCETQWLKNNKQ